MKIRVNGDTLEVPSGHTLADLVAGLAVGNTRFAIEVNENIIPRSTFEVHTLQPGDKVEVVTAIGGG